MRVAQFVSEGHANSSFAVVDRPWPHAVELRRVTTLTVRTRRAPALATCGVGAQHDFAFVPANGVDRFEWKGGPPATEQPAAAHDDVVRGAIDTLDLVVTVDTAVAHLAGSLGKPLWVLLSHIQDWRWMIARADNPWYPTARLFRQGPEGDWGPVIDRVAEALAGLPAAR